MLVPIIIVPAFFLMVGWVVYVVVDGFRRRQQLRLATEFHGKLLDRIGSAKEFGEFLNTSGGAQFLDSLTIEREGGPHLRILRALQTGLVCLALGVGLFLLIGSTTLTFGDVPGAPAPEFRGDEEDGIAVVATIFTSIGVGLLLSAGAAYGLSKRLGLINGKGDRRRTSPVHSA